MLADPVAASISIVYGSLVKFNKIFRLMEESVLNFSIK